MAERYLMWTTIFGLLTAYWLGVISESLATCAVTSVCSYPRTAMSDIAVLLFLLCAAVASYNGFMARKFLKRH